MIKHKDHFHGSDLEKIEQIYGIKKEEIVSFSANVNPLGVSPLLRTALSEQIDAITTYPDREYTSLRKCIAEYCGTEYENVIVGNGSTELISLFIQMEHPKKAMVIGPTYSEYEREISLGGGRILLYDVTIRICNLMFIQPFFRFLTGGTFGIFYKKHWMSSFWYGMLLLIDIVPQIGWEWVHKSFFRWWHFLS